MYTPDDPNPLIWIAIALTSVGFFGLLAAGVYDDYCKWKERKKGCANLPCSSFEECFSAILSRGSQAYPETIDEAVTNDARVEGTANSTIL